MEHIVAPIAQGNLCSQDQSFKTWNSRTNNTWPRSSSSYKRIWELRQVTQLSQWKHQWQMCWFGVCSCLRRWKQPFILGRIIWQTGRFTRTRTSRRLKVFSISLRNWYWNIHKKLWMWNFLKVHLRHGRDQYCSISSDPMCKSNSACLLRFSSMCGTDEWKQRSN